MKILARFFSEVFGRYRIRSTREKALEYYEEAERARAVGRLDDVETYYRNAIELDPKAVALTYNLGLLLQQLGDVEGAEASFRRALNLQPDHQPAHSSFLCLGDFSRTLSREEVCRRHIDWAREFADPLSRVAPRHRMPADSDQIRIGYISGDFCRHVTGRFIEPVLRHHDESCFDVFCYNNFSGVPDEMTRHLRALSAHWRDVSAFSDEELASVIRNDEIDILIDLSGHSNGNRLLVFARKPAPIQITWLGYLNTTGMEAVEYRLTDGVSDPEGSERWYSEKLLRLPQPQWCYVPEAGPVHAPARQPVNRREAAPVMFVCMTRFMKINSDSIRLWTRILQGVADSRLRIIDVPNHSRRGLLMQHFESFGLSDRVELFPTLHGEDYWNFLDEADIALDTFPYTGATTSCDCLWMGVPVVTLAGICGAARSASSLLFSIGLHELIASSESEYVRIAIDLAQDGARLSRLRSSMRRRMLESPICNPGLFTRNLEQQLKTVWSLYREKALAHG